MPILWKVQLIECLNILSQVLQWGFMAGMLVVAGLELRYGKKNDEVTKKELLSTFIFGTLTCVFFLAVVGFPWDKIGFWLTGVVGVIFGLGLIYVIQPAGFAEGKLHLKNYKLYAVVWALSVLFGQIILSVIDPQGTSSSGSFLFSFTTMATVTITNAFRHVKHSRRHHAHA